MKRFVHYNTPNPLVTIWNIRTPLKCALELIEEPAKTERTHSFREQLNISVDVRNFIQNCEVHSLQLATCQWKVRTPRGVRFGIFHVSWNFGELLSCCFYGQLKKHGHILGFCDEEVGAMVLADDWGMQEMSDGPFRSIEPIDPEHPQGWEVFHRKFSICLPPSRWILHSIRQKIRYLVLEGYVVRLRIYVNPQNQIFVSRSGLRTR